MRRSNYLQPHAKINKLPLKESSSFRKKSPVVDYNTKGLLLKNIFGEGLRYVTPETEQFRSSRPKSSHFNPKNAIGMSFEDIRLRQHKKSNPKRRSSVNTSMASKSRGTETSRSNNSSYIKRETTRMASNLKEILEKHLAFNTERKKLGKKEQPKYLSPRRDVVEGKGTKRTSVVKGVTSSHSKDENTTAKKDNSHTNDLHEENHFDYILKYSYRSRKGHTPSNPSKPNQDTYLISTNLHHQTYSHYFGVSDGHGQLGHKVSSFLKTVLPETLKRIKNFDSNPQENLLQCFKESSHRLCSQSKIDVSLSGATCIGCYLHKDTLYCCNVGDSRAIMGTFDKAWGCNELSEDHKPTVQSEAERIKQKKGVIQPFKHSDGTFVGPMRVWLPKGNGPGLAMTRSFGDLVAASVGVSSIPQIREYKMSQKDRILVIASDGVWEFVENMEVISLLSGFYEQDEIELGCDKLMHTVYNRWLHNSSVIDDITFVVIFLYYE